MVLFTQGYHVVASASGSVVVLEAGEAFFDLGMVRLQDVTSLRWGLLSVKVKVMVEALREGFEAEKMAIFFSVHGLDSVRRMLVVEVEAGSGDAVVKVARRRMGRERRVEECIVWWLSEQVVMG
jgi:hypothetical protein